MAIGKRAGRAPRIVDHDTDAADLGRGPLLVMGNLATGGLARRLYFTAYDFTDYAWPGRGGRGRSGKAEDR